MTRKPVSEMTDLELPKYVEAAHWYELQAADLTPEQNARVIEVEREIERRGIDFDADGNVVTVAA